MAAPRAHRRTTLTATPMAGPRTRRSGARQSAVCGRIVMKWDREGIRRRCRRLHSIGEAMRAARKTRVGARDGGAETQHRVVRRIVADEASRNRRRPSAAVKLAPVRPPAIAIAAGCVASALCAASRAETVVEYYNASLDHYFVTPLANEIDALDSGRT